MWESQAGMVAMALKDPDVISRVYGLYADLDTFTARREELREAFDTPEGQQLATDYRRWMLAQQTQQDNTGYLPEQGTEMKLAEFNNKTLALWSECQAVYNRAQPYRGGNVIEEDNPARGWRDRFRRGTPSAE